MTLLESAQSLDKDTQTREDFLWRILLTGNTGAGKSTLLTTMPGRKLFIDYDGRKGSIEGLPTIGPEDKVIQVLASGGGTAWDQAEKLKREIWSQIRKKTFPFDSIIEDGLNAMNRICMLWCLLLDSKYGLGGAPAKQHYGPHIKQIADHINSYLAMPVHYALTSLFLVIEDEETGAIKYFPKVFGKHQKTDVPSWFNEVWLCQKKEDKDKNQIFQIHTEGFGRYDFFKSALNQLSKYWKGPQPINLEDSSPGLEGLLDKRFGKEEKGEKR